MSSPGLFSARVLIFLVSILRLIYRGIKLYLEISQQKKPLPAEVANIYSTDQYQKFIAHEGDGRKLQYLHTALTSILEFFFLFSPVFAFIERVTGGNAYTTVLLTYGMYWLLNLVVDIPYEYFYTFRIDDKYGLNRMTKKEFAKDQILSTVEGMIPMIGVLLFFSFCGEHMSAWTNGLSVGWGKAILVGVIILAVFLLFIVIAQFFSYIILKKRYTFTPLPEGELRQKILDLMKGCKKKVSEIYVYDESKKSTEKNAFLLKFFWHREFGIADNFVNENDDEELLAVLSHEIGHLKHKKNFLDFVQYTVVFVLFAVIIILIHAPAPILRLAAWTRTSFQLDTTNYYVLFSVISSIATPLIFVTNLFGNYRLRRQEYEADMEAVQNGYGEALIATFEKLSSDELVDVNPHPLIEWLEANHPGMYTRISYIRRESEKRKMP